MQVMKTLMLMLCAVLSLPVVAADAPLTEVPEVFQRHSPGSTFRIGYSDLDILLGMMVMDVGRSTREKAAPTQPKVGTRVQMKVQRSTINEGNRFFFEEFKKSPENQQLLRTIRDNLAQVPDQVPLEHFSRDEQLAYWLNLYNFTLLDAIVQVYPERSLKKLLTGKDSVLEQKLIKVAGIPLSLNDIQHVILRQNYNNDPLVMYGLYQGIIGGPNIRKKAYAGETVQNQLANNAVEFTNSNRGTAADSETVFRVSSLYERNRDYFKDFDANLRSHLLVFLEGPERDALRSATRIKADIDDWTVTDVYGTYKEIGTGSSTTNAALLDAVQASAANNASGAGGGAMSSGNLSAPSSQMQARSVMPNRFSPEVIAMMNALKVKEDATAPSRGQVTVEEMPAVEVPATTPEGESDQAEESQPEE